jgi:predicted Na+-dependent transporter
MVSFNEVAGNVLLFFLVFGMSATVDIRLLSAQLRNTKAIIMGIFLQFGVLPLCGFLVVRFFELERSVGITLLVVTCSPGGSYSNW